MKTRVIIYALLLVLMVFASARCKKTDPDPPEDTYNPTPYNLVLPSQFTDLLPPMAMPTDNPLTVEGITLGRKLFYDKKLSKGNIQSCGTCHSPEFSFTDNGNQYSVGVDGLAGNRNTMAIINIGYMPSFFWDGRAPSAEAQAFGPVVNPIEMHETWPNAVAKLQADPDYPDLFYKAFGTNCIDSVLVSKAISQFERIMISGNSRFDKHLRGEIQLTAAEQNGFNIFMDETKGDCFHCHGSNTNPLWTDNDFHNNGLDVAFTDKGLGSVTGDPNDDGKFKSPTLRNLVFTAPYMHDGRFETLEQVVNHYSDELVSSATIDPLMKKVNQGGVGLTSTEKANLVSFLKSLSDSAFVAKTIFHDPN